MSDRFSGTLFDLHEPGLNPIYKRLCNAEEASDAEQKSYLDGLWARAHAHLDNNFKSAFARDTVQRFWELRLAAAFLDLGYPLDRRANAGPDLATGLVTGERLWVEAIAPTLGAGNNPDRPADLIPDGRFRGVPVEQILMRYTQALCEKRDRFARYREAGIINEHDRCVIAVSSAALWPHVEGVGLPRILSAAFGFGNERVVVDRKTGAVVRVDYEFRGEVLRAGGAPISTAAFLDPAYAMISGLIHDSASPTGWRQQGNARFVSANNPMSVVPVPPGYFPLGTEYYSERDHEWFTMRTIQHRSDGAPAPA